MLTWEKLLPYFNQLRTWPHNSNEVFKTKEIQNKTVIVIARYIQQPLYFGFVHLCLHRNNPNLLFASFTFQVWKYGIKFDDLASLVVGIKMPGILQSGPSHRRLQPTVLLSQLPPSMHKISCNTGLQKTKQSISNTLPSPPLVTPCKISLTTSNLMC